MSYSSEESIPLWHIYANKENGIRIGFPNVEIFTQESYFYSDVGNKNKISLNEVGGILYGQVEYDDSLASRSPSQGNDGIRMTHVYNMACQKRKVWSYEEELRYFIVDDANLIKDAKCLYVALNDTFFKDLIITFNPFMAEHKKNVIKEAVNNLDLNNVRFEESSLKGTIK